MAVIRALAQLKEITRSKVLRAAPRIQPLDLTLSLAIPLAVITRRLVLAHSVATGLAVIIRPMVLVLCFLIQLALTTLQLVLKCYLPTPLDSRMQALVRERSSQTPPVSTTRPTVFPH